MNKRIISLCLALVLLLCLLPSVPTAAAEEDVAINETNFPDENFRSYVSGNCDPNGDGVLSAAESGYPGVHLREPYADEHHHNDPGADRKQDIHKIYP